MKVKILLNKYNYIISYALVGSFKNCIEIDYNGEIKELKNHQYIDGELIYNPIPAAPLGAALKYDGEKWIETANIEEQIDYYKSMIISLTREYEIFKNAELTDDAIRISKKIEYAKEKYLDLLKM